MEKEHNFTTTDIFAEHLTLTFSLDNDNARKQRLQRDLVLVLTPIMSLLCCDILGRFHSNTMSDSFTSP